MADFNQILNNLQDTQDHTAKFQQADIESNKAMGILAYIGILFLVPMFAAKESRYAQFHVGQGIVLCVCAIVVVGLLNLLGLIPILGIIFRIISYICSLAFFALMVIGIINVVNGKAKELPFIGKYGLFK